MILGRNLLRTLDEMLDEAIAGTFQAQSYDESQLSKIESKMVRFLGQAQLRREQIEREQEKIRSLISDISHQTKTPVANVLLYAQLLCERDLSEEDKVLVEQITAGAEKLDFLIRSLIKTSRLESGIIKVTPQKADIREMVLSSIGECTPKARKKGIALSSDLTEPVHAMFDPKWCGEALYNIIDNAVKYTNTGGSVTLSIKTYEMFVRIDVKDTGRGICEDDLPRVFNRFWRADNESDGVGIGLFLSREIISVCGGYIKVKSKVGGGSVFSVFLPAA